MTCLDRAHRRRASRGDHLVRSARRDRRARTPSPCPPCLRG